MISFMIFGALLRDVNTGAPRGNVCVGVYNNFLALLVTEVTEKIDRTFI